jgi:Cu/Zn superoxide dismutase
VFLDTHLPLAYVDSSRSLFIAIYDKNNANKILSCSRMIRLTGREVRSNFDMDAVRGHFRFVQKHPFEPTRVSIKLDNLMGRGTFYHVHQFPFRPPLDKADQVCSAAALGAHFNPFKVDAKKSPPPGQGTGDEYELGDLSGKYGTFNPTHKNHESEHVDWRLPLFGHNSIVGRSIVIHKMNKDRWICAPITYPGALITARAVFHYPVVGEVLFRQLLDQPTAETSVHVRISYADGTRNTTKAHQWNVHEAVAGRDSFNWSRRCESAKVQFDPVHVSTSKYSSK